VADDVVAITPEIARALAALRDIELQAAGGGALLDERWLWWGAGIAGAVVGGLLLVGLALLLHPKGRAWRRWRALDRARRAARLTESEALAALAGLLREVAISKRAGAMPPGLTGDRRLAWLAARARRPDRGAFLGEAGRRLSELPYRPPGADNASADDLFALAARWLWANA
jgi:hypothetical protein